MPTMSARLRIIAGSLGGRLIDVPSEGTRPFADRVRQALFAVLEPRLAGARVLDLCAGSGAAGIEAISRGASSAVFVERSRRAAEVIRQNLTKLDLLDRAAVQVADAAAYVTATTLGDRPFDLVIADPPYDDLALRRSLYDALARPGFPLTRRGLVVLSGRTRHAGTPHEGAAEDGGVGLRLVRRLTFGETLVELHERVGRDDEPEDA